MIKRVLIANRGEIAIRVMRTCREMGIETVAVSSEADRHMPHARFADRVIDLGPGPVSDTYLDSEKILEAALDAGADAIHPGYGFLSENADFAEAVTGAGLTFVGPSAETIRLMGLKRESKVRMASSGVPVIPGYSGAEQDEALLHKAAREIGYPVLIKASAGGGGKGMRVVAEDASFLAELATAKREAVSAFGNPNVILEKYLVNPRHIEFQIFGDHAGNVVHLNERECSIQRRHQKIIEESPSPAIDPELRARMGEVAARAAEAVGYRNAGTVEFMLDQNRQFYFLEMNTRLQVEHGVTEMVTGFDLVRWQLLIAAGHDLPVSQSEIESRGHAVEARIYAEDPRQNFFPQTGRVQCYIEPSGPGIRVDSGIGDASEIGVLYDPMLAKLLVYGANRNEAIQKMSQALSDFVIHGVVTNISFLKQVIDHDVFASGEVNTSTIDRHFSQVAWDAEAVQRAMGLCLVAQGRKSGGGHRRVTVDPWEEMGSWRAGE